MPRNFLQKRFCDSFLKRSVINLFVLFLVFLTAILIFILVIIFYFEEPNYYNDQEQNFIITKGQSLTEVTRNLAQQHIIAHPRFFLYGARLLKGYDPKIYPGEYLFGKNIPYYHIIDKINKGDLYPRKITVAEGLSTYSILELVDKAPTLTGELPTELAEGSILPETYFYYYNETKEAVVGRMQKAMQETIDDLWQKRDITIPLKNKKEAIILASIVEKETGIKGERPIIASVFINRLKKGMKLQSDPTIIYSFTGGNKALERVIRKSDIRNKSAINTYHIHGLPPVAICNPGLDSLKAVLNPPSTNYLFFVASGNGGHYFSSNIKEHNKNVARYYEMLRKAIINDTSQIPSSQ